MTFEEICDINTEPFDMEILKEVYCPDYGQYAMMLDGFAALIFHYLKKFDERYGTALTGRIDIERIFSDEITESEKMLWSELIGDIMCNVMYESEWCIAIICIERSLDWEENFHEIYMNAVERCCWDCFGVSCFQQAEEKVRENLDYLENAEVIISWNDKLDRYTKYREENTEIINIICPKEDMYITILQEEIWDLFIISYLQETAECNGKNYNLAILGFDGENYCTRVDINPNWIIRAIKLSWMVDLAWEKIQCYEDKKISRRDI